MARSHSIEAAGSLEVFLNTHYSYVQSARQPLLPYQLLVELHKSGKSNGDIAKAFSTPVRQMSGETIRQWRIKLEAIGE